MLVTLSFLYALYPVISASFGIQSRIIGGANCDLRYPEINHKFMLSLRTYNKEFDFYEHFCGGTLLSSYWILTAGHCSQREGIYAVEAFRIDDIEYTGIATEVSAKIPHPKFDNSTNRHDIALLSLATPLYENENVQFVSLPKCESPRPDLSRTLIGNGCERATVMGWGRISSDTEEQWLPARLKCVDLKVASLEDCRLAHEVHKRNKTVYDENVCTEASTTEDFWKGDSGGPMMCGDVQYGIVSWGYGARGYPSVYTRVDRYLGFIRDNVCRAEGA